MALKKKKRLKKIVRNQSKSKKFFKKYGLSLAIFFILAIIYFFWIYGVPAILNSTVTLNKVNSFLEPKLGFKVDYSNSNFYTTPTLSIGVKFKNLKLFYPGSYISNDEGLFLQSRLTTVEMPIIPYMLKTIKFNELSLRTVKVNCYQNENGQYAYIENIKSNFNPQMPNYLLEVPEIVISSYNISNFNKKTQTFKKDRGNIMKIKAAQTKAILKSGKNAHSIMLR